jgi:hypothetical protein
MKGIIRTSEIYIYILELENGKYYGLYFLVESAREAS